jgi:hypothetical protein
LLAVGVAPVLAATAGASGAAPSLEPAIEATYLYKFAPFVEWPPSAFSAPDSPLTICVPADDPLAGLLAHAADGQKDGDRPIAVRALGAADSAAGCHVLYLGSGNQAAAQLAQTVQDHPVLTVANSAGDPSIHAMIVFVVDNNRVRFDIDDAAAARAGVAISSNLLALARNVKPAP